MAHLLVIDDDTIVVVPQLQHAFADDRVELATTAADGLAAIRRELPDIVLLDMRLPDATGLDVFGELRTIAPQVPVVFITTGKDADTAIAAMKRGAFDYLYKPLDLANVKKIVRQALEVSRLRQPVALGLEEQASALVGTSQAMLDVFKQIGRVAAQDVTVLITGESGTGKELVARAIWQHSDRATGPFLAINCAAIPEQLLESELFGYEKGAFTGAERRRIGKLEQCNGGTLLLDEVGDMPFALQAKLLRVLQERTFERVGGSEPIAADVRVIAATHRDLKTLRPDLYYRLSVFTIALPPLRERREDIPVLARHFVRRSSMSLGREITAVAPETLSRLASYDWPGNVRELESAIRRALLHASGTTLLPSFLPELATHAVAPPSGRLDIEAFIRTRLAAGSTEISSEAHDEIDRLLFTLVLDHTNGNLREAARVLGISRQTLRTRLRTHGLAVARVVDDGD
ncbi:MAG: sigma-54 dependent transcriptional regulator [Kofleriaceae bacterium]